MKFLIAILTSFYLFGVSANKLNVFEDDQLNLSNGFVSLTIDLRGGAYISSLKGDFKGNSDFGQNLLTEGGIRLERENVDGSISTAAGLGPPTQYASSTDGVCTSVQISSVMDDIVDPTVSENWSIELCQNERSFTFLSSGGVLERAPGRQILSIRHSIYATPVSTTGFFHNGVVQILGAESNFSHFASVDPLKRVFFLGETGSIDILRPANITATKGETDNTILLNSNGGSVGNMPQFRSGFHDVLLGSSAINNLWVSGQALHQPTTLTAKRWHAKALRIAPNNKNFPTSLVPTTPSLDNGEDMEAFMIGIYANSVPCLCTYPNEVTVGAHVAQIATTLRHGNDRGYDGTYNYFDPDNFFSLSAILYSGDEYLQNQVRMVVERTGAFIKEDNGQLPHHFNGITPYYLALSGETQTGPNTFWTKTALRYAAVTGDLDWLKTYMPTLRKAADFVFKLINPETNLVFAPGSLMIDVFIRNNYTSDSNAMVVGFLRDFAEAEEALGNVDTAADMRALSDKVASAMNEKLWASAESGADHFITQLNEDGSTRDFVDYDANLIAIANGVTDESRSRLIQQRVDQGQCAAAGHGGPQFVSEKYYGPEDTTAGNIGDSWCAMARIGWFDAHGRKRFGSAEDLAYINDRLLKPVQHDLLANTWMHERYACDGQQQENRTMYYFEYPAYVTMLLREIRYGVDVSLNSVSIKPFGAPETFHYDIGTTQVFYSQSKVVISVPGAQQAIAFNLFGLLPNRNFSVAVSGWQPFTLMSDDEGALSFAGLRGSILSVYLSSDE